MVGKIKASAAKLSSSDREKAIGMVAINKLQNFHSSYVREAVKLVGKQEDEVKTHYPWLYDLKEVSLTTLLLHYKPYLVQNPTLSVCIHKLRCDDTIQIDKIEKNSIQSLKRKTFQSAGIHVELSPKRTKTVSVIDDDENINPNTMHVNNMKSSRKNKGSLSPQLTQDVSSMKVRDLQEALAVHDLPESLKNALMKEEERKIDSSVQGQRKAYMEGQIGKKQEDIVEKHFEMMIDHASTLFLNKFSLLIDEDEHSLEEIR